MHRCHGHVVFIVNTFTLHTILVTLSSGTVPRISSPHTPKNMYSPSAAVPDASLHLLARGKTIIRKIYGRTRVSSTQHMLIDSTVLFAAPPTGGARGLGGEGFRRRVQLYSDLPTRMRNVARLSPPHSDMKPQECDTVSP